MKTITKTQRIQEGDRTHIQTVSIDFEDRFMSIMHNGEEIALSIDIWTNLHHLINDTLWGGLTDKVVVNEKS